MMGIRVFGDLRRLAASRSHEFLSERGELFRPRSGHASDEVEGGLHLTLHFNFQTVNSYFSDCWHWSFVVVSFLHKV